jgi:hypothetical protein
LVARKIFGDDKTKRCIMLKKIILFTAIGYINSQLFLQAQDLQPAGFCSGGLFYDQDYTLQQFGLKKLNEDRNYTMGLGLYYSNDAMKDWVIYKPNDWLFETLHPKLQKVSKFYNIMLANGSFTPDSLPAYNPIFNDRPYASLTYIQANESFLYVNGMIHRMYSVSLSAGILGSYISREVQTYIHTHSNDNDTKDPRTPRGWGNQISNGGAPTMLLGYQQDYLITKTPLYNRENNQVKKVNRFGGEWKAAWRANVGWYNMVSGEVSYRFGLIDPRNWTYMTNPLGSSNTLRFASVESAGNANSKPGSYYDSERKGEIYLFASIRNNIVAYNVLLSGQGGADAVNIPNNWVRHEVLDGNVGLCFSPVIHHRTVIDLKSKINFRSPEFEAPGRKPRWHYWGGIELVVTVLK